MLDRNHNVLCKKDYNDKLNVVTLRHNDELGTEMCISTNVENDPFSTNSDEKSSISRYLISYDDDGFIETIRFARFQNVPTGTPEGLYGYDYPRDRDGRILHKSTAAVDGKLKANFHGVSFTSATHVDPGHCIAISRWRNHMQSPM